MKKILWLFLFAVPACAQFVPQKAASGFCLNSSLGWLVVNTSGTPTGFTPQEAFKMYGTNAGTPAPLVCDANGNITTGAFNQGTSLPATCSPGQVFATVISGSAVYYGCSSANTWTSLGSGGGGSGTVTAFAAPSASWPTWLVPTVATSTTTPSLSVTAGAIPNSALANVSTTVNGQTCTLGSTCTVSVGVTSVALVGSANLFGSTAGTAVTSSGNLNLDSQLATQVANCILAGPSSGSAAAPTCRSLVASDLPFTVANGTLGYPAIYNSTVTALVASALYIDASQESGADVGAKINSCVTSAVSVHASCSLKALTGGTISPYAPSLAAETINLGDSNDDSVTIILPDFGYIACSMTGGTSPCMKMWPGATIIGSNLPGTTRFAFGAANGSNLSTVCDTDPTQAGSSPAGGKYLSAKGFACVDFNTSGTPTASWTTLRVHNYQDATNFEDIGIFTNNDPFAVQVNGMCCGAQFNRPVINCNYDSPAIGAITFTNGSAVIGIANNNFIASASGFNGSPVTFATTGGLPTGFTAGTLYYVIATGLTSAAFEVSATAGGAAITAGSAGTGTQTATTPCQDWNIEDSTSGDTANWTLGINQGSSGHPGVGGSTFVISDTEGTNSATVSISHHYLETSSTNGTQPIIEANGIRRLDISDVDFRSEISGAAATFTPIQIGAAYNTDLMASSSALIASSTNAWAANNPYVVDVFTGKTLLADTANTHGAWIGGNSFINNATVGVLTVAQAGTATSGANFGSNAVKWVTDYWTGSAAAAGGWTAQVNDAAGSNPAETLAFTSNGASATNPVTFPGPLTAGSGITQGAGNTFTFNGRSRIASAADGQLTLYNNAQTAYARLGFGGTTSSFGALCTSATTITVCGADGSAVGTLVTPNLTVSTFSTAGIVTNNASGALATQTLAAAGVATALSIPTGTATYTPGTSVTSCGCSSGYLCNNTRGTLTIVGGTATTGTICTVNFSATLSAAPACFAWMNGGATFFGIGNGAPTSSSFTVTSAVSVAASTANVNYTCQP